MCYLCVCGAAPVRALLFPLRYRESKDGGAGEERTTSVCLCVQCVLCRSWVGHQGTPDSYISQWGRGKKGPSRTAKLATKPKRKEANKRAKQTNVR